MYNMKDGMNAIVGTKKGDRSLLFQLYDFW